MVDRKSLSTKRHGMTLRSSTRSIAPQPRPWRSLPAEIRLLILEAAVEEKHPGWASFASVCQEWQLFIEEKNFRRLKLQVPCLDDFERITIQRQHLVRHISLNIELSGYTCRSCDNLESASWESKTTSIVSKGIWKLFSILGLWKPADGLALELSAYSPSDSDHWFKHYQFASDTEGDSLGKEATSGRQIQVGSGFHDPQHGWVNGQQARNPPMEAILRLFSPLDLRFQEPLPQVNAVTCLIVRRQLRRQFRPLALQLMLDKLCRLEHMIYEPWRPLGPSEMVMDHEPLFSVQESFPKALKTLSVFEDFDDRLAPAFNNAPFPVFIHGAAARVANPVVGAAFASTSLDLEQLSVSYLANAEDFFQARMPTWSWQCLHSLSLTSQLLRPTGTLREIHALLSSAAVAALKMPLLRTLVLWNGKRGNACAFIYDHTDRGRPGIRWRGTWHLELSLEVVKAWQGVASKFGFPDLGIESHHIQGVIKCHGDAIHCLGLPCQVVAPASLWQIRREGAYLAPQG